VGEIYPELVESRMKQGVKDIRLEQLLSHNSGIPADSMEQCPAEFLLGDRRRPSSRKTGMRYTLVSAPVPPAAAFPARRAFRIFQPGYTLAGAKMERVHGQEPGKELVVAPGFSTR